MEFLIICAIFCFILFVGDCFKNFKFKKLDYYEKYDYKNYHNWED